MKTQDIAGHKITLQEGNRYIASRPMAEVRRQRFPVSIRLMTNSPQTWDAEPVVVIEGLSYEESNALLSEFNNGPSSYQGRVW